MTAARPVATRPLRVLIAHNRYQHRGGEDVVVEAEAALLERHGHQVLGYARHNDEIAPGGLGKLALLKDTLWSQRTVNQATELFQRFKPDVLHVHNTLPLISPAIYWAAAKAGVPVVQTLHNFRLLCPQGLLLREQRVCEDCVGHVPWRAVQHRCYRGSAAQSAAVASTLQLHRWLGTWRDKVSLYIALNDFCRDKFVQGGLPTDRIRVKPNFCAVPTTPPAQRQGFLFVGRLSPEKGIHTLAAAARLLPAGVQLRVAGTGPEADTLAGIPAVQRLGSLPQAGVYQAMASAQALVVPSICNEMFGMTVIEAFANSLPVIASRIGALAHIVEDGVTGLLAEPDNPEDLARCLRWALAHPEAMQRMGAAAKARHTFAYTPDANLQQVLQIYWEAIGMQSNKTT